MTKKKDSSVEEMLEILIDKHKQLDELYDASDLATQKQIRKQQAQFKLFIENLKKNAS